MPHRYSDRQIATLIEQALDPEKQVLVCEKHHYVASIRNQPTKGCKSCWMAYYVHELGRTPPHLREEKLDQLENIIKGLTMAEDKGQLTADLTPPQLHFGSDYDFEEQNDRGLVN